MIAGKYKTFFPYCYSASSSLLYSINKHKIIIKLVDKKMKIKKNKYILLIAPFDDQFSVRIFLKKDKKEKMVFKKNIDVLSEEEAVIWAEKQIDLIIREAGEEKIRKKDKRKLMRQKEADRAKMTFQQLSSLNENFYLSYLREQAELMWYEICSSELEQGATPGEAKKKADKLVGHNKTVRLKKAKEGELDLVKSQRPDKPL